MNLTLEKETIGYWQAVTDARDCLKRQHSVDEIRLRLEELMPFLIFGVHPQIRSRAFVDIQSITTELLGRTETTGANKKRLIAHLQNLQDEVACWSS